MCCLRGREILLESIAEYQRKGNYVRIFPAKGSDIYDTYFVTPRSSNRLLYRCLYTDDLMTLPDHHTQEKLNYVVNFELPKYDTYKKLMAPIDK
jgi:hypothetical protein